jgi:hypothetical protein
MSFTEWVVIQDNHRDTLDRTIAISAVRNLECSMACKQHSSLLKPLGYNLPVSSSRFEHGPVVRVSRLKCQSKICSSPFSRGMLGLIIRPAMEPSKEHRSTNHTFSIVEISLRRPDCRWASCECIRSHP